MAKDLLSLLYGQTLPEIEEISKQDIKDASYKQAVRAGYKVNIVWKEYDSHRSTVDKRIILKTPQYIESELAKIEWQFDLAEAILSHYGITVSSTKQ